MDIVFYIIIFIIGIIIGNVYKMALNKKVIGLQIVTGILFTLFALAMKINVNNIEISNVITLGFVMMYLTFLVLIASVEYKEKKVGKPILIYGIAISVIYIIYLCIMEKANILRYAIYLVLIAILLLIDNINTKKKAEDNYLINLLWIILVMVMFTGEYISIITIVVTLITIALYLIINNIRNLKKNVSKNCNPKIQIGLIISIINITVFVLNLLYTNYLS